MGKKGCILMLLILMVSVLYGATYKDGTYSAESFSAYKGWISVVEVDIKNGEISDVRIEDFNRKKERRSESLIENEKLKKSTNYNFKELSSYYKEKLLEKKSPDLVDSIAGATTILKRYKNLTKAALKNAEKGDTNRVID